MLQSGDAEDLLQRWKGDVAVLLDTEAFQASGQRSPFSESFQTVYAFNPLAIKVPPSSHGSL